MSNLQQRVITALVIAAVLIATLASGSHAAWTLFVTMFCAAAYWEGLRLLEVNTGAEKFLAWTAWVLALVLAGARELGVEFSTAGLAQWLSWLPQALLALAAAFWLLVAPRQLSTRADGRRGLLVRVAFVILIVAAWLSAVALQRLGALWLVAVVVITVVADIAGYFVGRAFGRVKLAPMISPGKTREGAMGGVVAAASWTAASASYLGLATSPAHCVLAALAGAALGVLAVMGDLWESLLKRQAGVKDSSQLLPGHGGVLDRIDAQLAVLPTATLLLSLVLPLWR